MGHDAGAAGVEIDVKLSPAGSYKAKTEKVKGVAYKTADGIEASGVTVDLNSLKTGIELRDKHTKERLMSNKYPQAKLIKASGKDGKGTATLEIKGKKIEVTGSYKIVGNELQAQFPVQLPALEINDVKYMGVGVKDEVVVNINLPLSDAPARGVANAKKKK